MNAIHVVSIKWVFSSTVSLNSFTFLQISFHFFVIIHCSLSVLVYIALYRLDELGIAHFKKFVVSHEANKMFKVRIISVVYFFLILF